MRKNIRAFALIIIVLLLAAAASGCVKHKHIVLESRWVGDFFFSIYEDGTAEITAYKGAEEYLKLPNKVGDYTVIGFGTKAFDGCETIKQVLIPPTVRSLPPKLFNACPNLESVYIPASVKSAGRNVISECPAFATVLYEGTSEQWAAIDVGASPWTDNYVLINAEIVYGYELD